MNATLAYTAGDLWLTAALSFYAAFAIAYWILGQWLDGPYRGSDQVLLVLTSLLWPAMPFVLLWRHYVTITRNTAKAPSGPGAPAPALDEGPEEPAPRGGGSAA